MAGDVDSDDGVPTRDRLLAAAIRLFSTKGFEGTAVGEIEAAVGLQPRRGTLYKHFSSKAALLQAAVDRGVVEAEKFRLRAEGLLDMDLHALGRVQLRELALQFGREYLRQLDAHRDLTHILEHEGERFPELRTQLRREVIEPGYRAALMVVERSVRPGVDHTAVTALLLSSLVGLRRTEWTFGKPPLGVGDRRALETWADQCIELI